MIFDKSARVYSFMEYEEPISVMRDCVLTRSKLGAYTFVGIGTFVTDTSVGRYCSFGPDCRIGPGEHPANRLTSSSLAYNDHFSYFADLSGLGTPFQDNAPIEVGNDVWIGANSIVRNGVTIGDGAIVAAGSVVTKDVAPYAIVGGTPAKLIRYRFDDRMVERLLHLRWWRFDLPAWFATGRIPHLATLTPETLDQFEQAAKAESPPVITGRRHRAEIVKTGAVVAQPLSEP